MTRAAAVFIAILALVGCETSPRNQRVSADEALPQAHSERNVDAIYSDLTGHGDDYRRESYRAIFRGNRYSPAYPSNRD
jgi:hypothetical protein